MATRIIQNFTGKLTRVIYGDVDSGNAKYSSTFGNDPFSSPGNLTWFEAPTQIDPNGAVITDLIVAGKARLESGITYVYAIGHTGRLYKIQVNDPNTYNPNYDNPVLLTTLTINTPTFKYGSSINFYGSTEKIFIGHDIGVTMIGFDGTGETFIGAAGSYTANVPRPGINFTSNLYFGNGTNLVKIDTTNTVISYGILSPSLPVGTQIRDLDVSADGNYIQMVSSRVPQSDLTTITQDTSSLSSGDSYRFMWNGIDPGITTFETYNSYSMSSNISFGTSSFTMGYDLNGAAIYAGGTKIISLPLSRVPNFASMFSTGNLLGFAAPEEVSSALKGTLMVYGQYDQEIPKGTFRFFRMSASGSQTDVIQMPMTLIVSSLFYGSSSSGYSGNQVGSAKLYFSTLETSSAPTTKYKLYKFITVPTGLGTTIGGVYETQTEESFRLFRSIVNKKFKVTQVRLYTQPLVNNNSFKIDIIGSDGNPMSGGSKTFSVGSGGIVSGQDYLWYTPTTSPTHSVAFRFTNLGTANWVGVKCEFDYEQTGQ